MSREKIGIITLYKNSCNYGGLLQAFALTRVLNDMGYEAIQILLGDYKEEYKKRSLLTKIKEHGLSYAIELFENRIYNMIKKTELQEMNWRNTQVLCREFREEIPHTSSIDEDDLSNLDNRFDCFIVGSDQVWNPKWVRDVYLLEFTNKKKLSYAASIARYDFSKFEKRRFLNELKKFDWISLREAEGVKYLRKQFELESSLVLDPTMLLDKVMWSTEERVPKGFDNNDGFIFCYFFRGTKEKRLIAHKEAVRTGYKLVFPIWNGETINYNNIEKNEQLIDGVGPREFLWLIHNSKKVMTDSFHGTVLSIVFEKQFLHIVRDSNHKSNMNSRIYSLMDQFEIIDWIYKGDDSILEKNIDYDRVSRVLKDKRKESVDLLRQHLS